MGSIPGVLLVAVLVSVSLMTSPVVSGGKILVFPLDDSHWINMNLVIQSLHARGHEVTVVRSATSWYIKEDAAHYNSIIVTLPEAISLKEQDFFVMLLAKMLALQRWGAGGCLSFAL